MSTREPGNPAPAGQFTTPQFGKIRPPITAEEVYVELDNYPGRKFGPYPRHTCNLTTETVEEAHTHTSALDADGARCIVFFTEGSLDDAVVLPVTGVA
jgi:hypothetical protein